jgi:thiol:disulfide interchange protein DsbD
VKSLFGVALLAMALVYLRDLVPGLRAVFSPTAAALHAAALAAAIGVLLGAVQGSFHGTLGQKLAKGSGVALLSLALFYGAGVGQARAARDASSGPAWMVNREAEGLALARAEGKPVVIDFWGDWCAACKELDHTAWSDPAVQAELQRFVAIKMDNSADKTADAKTSDMLDQVFAKYGIVGQPTVIFIDPHGRELPAEARVTGVIGAQEMLRRLRAVDQACTLPAVACLARW